MRNPHLLADDYDVMSFQRLCRREQPLRDATRANREAEEAKREAQQAPSFDPFDPETPALLRRQAE